MWVWLNIQQNIYEHKYMYISNILKSKVIARIIAMEIFMIYVCN